MNIEPTMSTEADPESSTLLGRRSFVLGATALGLLAGSPAAFAATKASKAKNAAKTSGTIALQSNNSDDKSKKGMEALVAAFNAKKLGTVKLNTVAGELYRTQLTQYLTSSKPPEVLTWLAGKAAQNYADQGLLLDVSDVWASPEMTGYSSALRGLSTDSNGKQIFVPIYYYWCGVYYRPSKFAEWGVKPPKTFEDTRPSARRFRTRVSPRLAWVSPTRRGSPRSGSTISTFGSTERSFTATCSAGRRASTHPR
jgi:ABC-type glycerol-3-phosphate transport system substrate-binding protein